MARLVGTTVRGLRGPIIHQGDDLVDILTHVVQDASEAEGYAINDRDILTITESVVARAQGNYASLDAIAQDVQAKFASSHIGIVFPILSRNRFQQLLKGLARGVDQVTIQLSYPSDEVGNHLISLDNLDEKNINPWQDVLTEAEFREAFGDIRHTFTGVDYVKLYQDVCAEENCACEIIFSNKAESILDYTKDVLVASIHSRKRDERIIKEAGGEKVLGLDDLMTASIAGSGFNSEYGLLGSNMATDESVKLFPENCMEFVQDIQERVKEATGKTIEVMVYGDGAFKDPQGKIWELADPIVCPGHTAGLAGTPNEIKLKYLADNDFADLSGEALEAKMQEYIKNREVHEDNKNEKTSLGTTPRQITDLLGSLSDLTSGSGDKGTPFVYIQGYFDNYANN